MYRTIVVPLDGSALASRALPYARALATAETRIVLVRAVPPPTSPPASQGTDKAVGEAEAYLTKLAHHASEGQTQVLVVARAGDPATTILAEACRHDADLIVMASHRRSAPGRLVFGSVSDEVVRRADVPVLVVPGRGESWATSEVRRILVPLDGSERAETALAPAIELTESLNAALILLHVVEPAEYFRVTEYPAGSSYLLGFDGERGPDDDLSELARQLQRPGLSVNALVEGGDPVTTILAVAEEERVDAIVMASHGRGGLARLALGSVTEGVARRSTAPVLVVNASARVDAPRRLASKAG